MEVSVILCSKNPLWLYQGFSSPLGGFADSLPSTLCRLSGSFPSSAFFVNKAKSKRSIGVAPSTVNSLPIRCSSSKPLISWQPAHPNCLISNRPGSFKLVSARNEESSYCGGVDNEKR